MDTYFNKESGLAEENLVGCPKTRVDSVYGRQFALSCRDETSYLGQHSDKTSLAKQSTFPSLRETNV